MSVLLTRLTTRFSSWNLHSLLRGMIVIARAAPSELRITTLLNLIFGAGPALVLWLGKIIIDEVTRLAQSNYDDPWQLLLHNRLLVSCIAISIILRIILDAVETLGTFQIAALRDRASATIKALIYRHIAAFDDIALFENPRLLDIKQLAEQSIPRMEQLVYVSTNFIIGIGVSIPVIVLAFGIAWWAPFIIFLSALPSIYAQTEYSNKAWSIEQGQADRVRRMRVCEQALTEAAYAKELRLFGLQFYFLERWQTLFSQVFAELQALRHRGAIVTIAWSIVSGLGSALPYVFVISEALTRRMSLGDLALYAGLVFEVRRSMYVLIGNATSLQDAGYGAKALFQLLDLRPSLENNTKIQTDQPQTREQARGIQIQNVSFRYPEMHQYVLNDIQLHLHPGKLVVMVGENGAGKTTLAKLLCRFYDPQSGHIYWDGTNLYSLDLTTLRQRITVLSQDFARFPASLQENIGFGQLQSLQNQEQIMAAAKAAGLGEVIDRLPDGLQTLLTRQFSDGVDLSGGQWQRVALARALMRLQTAELIILDEPSAALDPHAEHELTLALRSLLHGKIGLVISHRLSLAREADHIVVLEQGRILEQGSHTELIACQGRYYELFQRQASSYQE